MIHSQPIKWHGGKFYLADRIIALMPPHIHYVEPFAGGLSVLLRKNPDGISEVVNDLNCHLMNFWRVLASVSMFEAFAKKCQATPFSQPLWEAVDVVSEDMSDDPVSAAHAFFVKFRQSRQGMGDCFATMSRTRTRHRMNEQVSSWLSAIEGLPEAHARLQRVVILNDDAYKVIQQQDGERTLFYCDPPYLHTTRTATDCYEHEMTDTDHSMLLDVLGGLRGKMLLSGYRSDLYDDRARLFGWRRVEIEIPNHSSSAKTKEIKTECVWCNYD